MANSTSELLARVRNGNQKLWDAWLEACQSDNADYEVMMCRIDKSIPRLHSLCLRLQASGFDKCLYDKPRCCQGDDDNWFCYACPSAIPYWREGKAKQLSLVGGEHDSLTL